MEALGALMRPWLARMATGHGQGTRLAPCCALMMCSAGRNGRRYSRFGRRAPIGSNFEAVWWSRTRSAWKKSTEAEVSGESGSSTVQKASDGDAVVDGADAKRRLSRGVSIEKILSGNLH